MLKHALPPELTNKADTAGLFRGTAPSSAVPLVSAAIARLRTKIGRDDRQIDPYVIVWWCLVGCILAAFAQDLFGTIPGPLSYAVTIAGSAGCAWLWLFSRLVFRATQKVDYWPLLVVGGVIAVESSWALSAGNALPGALGEFHRISANAAHLVCVGALMFVFVETFAGYSAAMPKKERRLRQVFAGFFAAIVTLTFVFAMNASETSLIGAWQVEILLFCAVFFVGLTRATLEFRKRNPLTTAPRRKRSQPVTDAPAASDEQLAARILDAASREDLVTTPNLKVADFAKAIGEHDYKVTQCITGTLQYANFNQFINTQRINYAKRALCDGEDNGQSILAISFDCGFNSVGPFNRAFKQCTGMTPKEFRALGQTSENA